MTINNLMDSQLKDMLIAHSTDKLTKLKCLLLLIKRKIGVLNG